MSLEFKGFGEVIPTIKPENVPTGSVEKVMNFFNQPGYKPITEEEAKWLINEVREGMKKSQENTEEGILETQKNIAA